MKLSEKIRYARERFGISKEQLAERLGIPSSKVEKWEDDKSHPSVEELKALTQILDITIDSLLDDCKRSELVMHADYVLTDYGKGTKKKKKDRAIREKFPNAKIHTLVGILKLTKKEKIIDNFLGFFTDAPFGTPELINSIENLDKEFYLVDDGGEQFVVTVTDEFIEAHKLFERIQKNKFEMGNWKFVVCKHELK